MQKNILYLLIAISFSGFSQGDDCTDAIDLCGYTSGTTGTYAGTTTGMINDFSFCSMSSSEDMIFFLDLPDGETLTINQSTNGYDSRHSLRRGGACPGTTQIVCTDDSDTKVETYTNSTGATERVYWIQAGFGSNDGSFTLVWSVTVSPCGPPPTCTPDFSFTSEGGSFCSNETETFTSTSTSTGNITSQTWTYHDASTDAGASSTYDYSTGGSFDVDLRVTDDAGCDETITKTVNVVNVFDANVIPANGAGNCTDCFTLQADTGEVTLGACCTGWSTFSRALASNFFTTSYSDAVTVSGIDPNTQVLYEICLEYVTYTDLSQLLITMTCPSGQVLTLTNANGGAGDSYGNPGSTCFTIDAATSITTGSGDHDGDWIPQDGDLYSNTSGCNYNGTWTLNVTDLSPGDGSSGNIDDWHIQFRGGAITALSNIQWEPAAQVSLPNNGVTSACPSNDGDTDFIFTAIDQNGCTVRDTAEISLNCPLSIDFIDFDVNCSNQRINLEWKTDQFDEVKYFVIEGSNDGNYFEELNQITPQENNGDLFNYSPSRSMNYYRIIAVEETEYSVSEIQKVECFNNFNFSLTEVGNGNINLMFSERITESASIRVFDVLGKILYNVNIEKDILNYEIPINDNISSSTYFIVIGYQDNNYSNKWIVR